MLNQTPKYLKELDTLSACPSIPPGTDPEKEAKFY